MLLTDKTISEIHDGFRTGKLTPLDIAKECIKAYRKNERDVLAWTVFDEELLLRQAREAGERIRFGGPIRLLEGIPVAVKDIINTADFPTQMGSPLWEGFTPGNDARVVSSVKHQGALVPGKTVTAEFAVHTLNKTLNPHDSLKTPGTSSSGSAVAVATGMVPVALGTQTAGSIMRPASFCGVYGCKPSFGLIPRTGMLKTTDSLDTVGFFSTHYLDLERVFEAVRVHGPNYPMSYRVFKDPSRVSAPSGRAWRVGFARTHTWKHAPEYAKAAVARWLNQVSRLRGVEVSEVTLPKEMALSHSIHETIYNKTLSYYFKKEYEKSELVSPIMNELIRSGQSISIKQYHTALSAQEKLCRAMDLVMTKYDVLVSLSTAGEAPQRGIPELPDPSLIWTMTHLPVIGVPQFVSPGGLPYGLQFVSRRYNDYKLFRFADFLRSKGCIPAGLNPKLKTL